VKLQAASPLLQESWWRTALDIVVEAAFMNIFFNERKPKKLSSQALFLGNAAGSRSSASRRLRSSKGHMGERRVSSAQLSTNCMPRQSLLIFVSFTSVWMQLCATELLLGHDEKNM
jgi:hypothetical protein